MFQPLGIRYPIVQAGMAAFTTPELVAAVSNAGGMGTIGTVFRPLDDIEREVAAVRRLTERPFAVNVVLAEPHGELIELLIAERVPVISTSWGDPAEVTERAHAAGLLAMHQVETVSEAERVIAGGVDVVIAQGTDGGGHVGKVGTLALVPAVVDVAGSVPVLAAGGIADGRGLAAALALGANGALVGTRFLATEEAGVIPGWKQALLDARPEDAWQTDVDDLIGESSWPGATVRALANRFMREWHGREAEIPAHRAALQAALQAADAAGDREGQYLYAGASAGLIHEILPAAEVVRRLMAEAEATLRRIALPGSS